MAGGASMSSTGFSGTNVAQGSGGFTEFRLKFDQKTKQHKGYGFVNYQNRDVTLAAIRNLNGY